MNTEKIEKLKKGLTNSQIPETLREKIRQQISRLEAEDKANEAPPKEEAPKEEAPKAEATPKKEPAPKKARAPRVAKAPTVRKPRVKKVVEPKTPTTGKNTAMALAKEIRKDGEKWTDAVKRASSEMKKGTKQIKKSTNTELKKLLALVKKRKELKGISGTDLKRDSSRKAKPRGKRVSKDGNVYYENRDNRTDRLSPNYPKNAPLLAGGGGVWTEEQSLKVAELDAHFERQIKKLGIERNSKEASDFWKSGGFQNRMKKIFNKEYELGGGVDATMTYDLAGNTSGGTGGLNAGMPLSDFSGTNYTGLVGETGAMSAGEMFAGGGGVKKDRQINMLLKNKGLKEAINKDHADRLRKIIENDGISTKGVSDKEMLLVSKILLKEKYQNGGGLPSGAMQSYVNNYLGEGTAQGIYEHGGKMHDYKKMEENYANGGFMNNVYADGGGVDSFDVLLLWRGYASAILFAEMDYDTDEPLDNNYTIYDFDEESEAEAKKMLSMYYLENKEAIKESGLDLETIGMDIWYTQGGHGAGFFDHSLTDKVEGILTRGAQQFGMPSIETNDGKVIIRGIKFENFASGGGIRTVNGREYPTGRNWTNDHRQHNKSQDYEVPKNNRK